MRRKWPYKSLAIADTVWTEKFGVGSHQPIYKTTVGAWPILFMDGKYRLIATNLLYVATRNDRILYWAWFLGRGRHWYWRIWSKIGYWGPYQLDWWLKKRGFDFPKWWYTKLHKPE